MKDWRWPSALGLMVAAEQAVARSLGDMAQEAATDLDVVPNFIEIALYIVGLLIVAVGVFRIKKHFDQPQQVGLGGALVTVGVGVALLLLPTVINGVADTFGATGGGPIVRPRL